jgi:flavin-binding protein dodecin
VDDGKTASVLVARRDAFVYIRASGGPRRAPRGTIPKGAFMAESVYKVIELIGTSTQSWEKAAAAAVKLASKSLRDLRVAEVSELDLHIVDGKTVAYRAKVKLSFKYADVGADSEPKKVAAKAKAEEPAAEPAPVKKAAKKAKRRAKKG